MRNIEARYREQERRDNGDIRHGAYIHLAEAVKHQKFSRKCLVKAFKKLMPKDEYLTNESNGLVSHLEHLTNLPVAVEIGAKNRLKASENIRAGAVINNTGYADLYGNL